MKIVATFLSGFILAVLLVGGAWHISSEYNLPRRLPTQIPFDSQQWKEGGSGVKGQMHRDAIRFLETERPSKSRIIELFGPSGYQESANLNGADLYYIYQVDLGQRIGGKPFLDKIGIAFHDDGSYSHTTKWD